MRDRVPAASPVRHRFVNEQGRLNFGMVGGLLGFVMVSGLAITALPFHVYSEVLVILHTVIGAAVAAVTAVWLLSHWLGTRKAPRSPRKISAYIGFWLLTATSAAGFVTTWQGLFGPYMSHFWAQLHLWTGIIAIPFLIHHVIPALGTRERPEGLLPDLRPGRRRMWRSAAANCASQFVLAGILAALGGRAAGPQSEAPPGGNLFAPSNVATEDGRPLPLALLSNSESCGVAGCHTAIYEEWRADAHRWSAEDEFFQTVRQATTELQGRHVTEKCAACHEPVSLLVGQKDPTLGHAAPGCREGDSCVVCHAVRRVDERGIGSYVLGVPRPYLFEASTAPFARRINHFLIRAYPAQHSRDYNLAPVRKAESCAPCHKEYDQIVESQGPVQVETQYDDWKQGKWNTDRDPHKRLYCQQCHMYYVESGSGTADPYDLKAGLGQKHRNHFFAAANQFMPEALRSADSDGQIKRVSEWLEGRRIVPEIQTVWPKGPVVALKIDAPGTVKPGDTVRLQTVLTNNKAGHGFPTGPLNIVRAWVELSVQDGTGKQIFHSGLLDAENHIEPGSYVLKPLAIDLHGRMILEPDLWHPEGPKYRPAILAGQSASYDYEFRFPPGVRGPLAVRARLRYRKANQFFVDSVYPGAHRTARVTDVSAAAVKIEVMEVPVRGTS